MTDKQLCKIKVGCAAIAGENGWCKSDGEEIFVETAVELVGHGFTVDDAVALLSRLYWKVAQEFGA